MPHFQEDKQERKLRDLHKREEENLIRTLAPKYGYQYVNLFGVSISTRALRLIPERDARAAEAAAFHFENKKASIAIRNPKNARITEVLQALVDQRIEVDVFMASIHSLEHAWERYEDTKDTSAEQRGVLDVDPESIEHIAERIKSPLDVANEILEIRAENGAKRVTKTIEVIFGGALALNASDVHIEPKKKVVRVRYRMDGVLWDITDIEHVIYGHLNSRLKLISGIKINVTDEAQDGRFTFNMGDRTLEIRSSVIPGSEGESFVMRLLDPDTSRFEISTLGLNARLEEVVHEELKRPNGSIITTGPTGSGKTTALYSFLQEVHKPDIKIITIEDPVEYKLKDIVQTQVGDNYTFASGLRALLRQDPDVIMVGEIRDREVAATAVNAALTGHLVFSTLHTNSAVGAFARLIDLGVDYRMIGSAFNMILGQRLARRLCPHCKQPREATVEEIGLMTRIMGTPPSTTTLYEPAGCDQCGHSGFKGRIGVYEGILVDKAVESAIIQDPRESVILKAAEQQNIPTMQQDGVMKLIAGITSFDELARVVDLYNKTAIIETEETPPHTPATPDIPDTPLHDTAPDADTTPTETHTIPQHNTTHLPNLPDIETTT